MILLSKFRDSHLLVHGCTSHPDRPQHGCEGRSGGLGVGVFGGKDSAKVKTGANEHYTGPTQAQSLQNTAEFTGNNANRTPAPSSGAGVRNAPHTLATDGQVCGRRWLVPVAANDELRLILKNCAMREAAKAKFADGTHHNENTVSHQLARSDVGLFITNNRTTLYAIATGAWLSPTYQLGAAGYVAGGIFGSFVLMVDATITIYSLGVI
jgi:hypothetical protein